MNVKYLWLFVLAFLTIYGCSNAGSSGRKPVADNQGSDSLENVARLAGKLNTTDSVVFITKQINYHAPKSGSVNLAWNVENYPQEEALSWNSDAKLMDNLLYLPMEAHGDTFKVQVKLPVGAHFQYYFWITKNKEGHYQDFWDLQSSGSITIVDAHPLNAEAVYSKAEGKKEAHVLSKGWMILLLLLGVYVLLYIARKKWASGIEPSSVFEKILFLGFSMIIFGAIARAEIIGVSPLNFIHNLNIFFEIVKGSADDFMFIFGLVFVFILATLGLKNVKVRKWIYGIFLFLALFSTLVAYTNITTVVFLGKPFSYQWLYYSDFLGSTEAKTAMQENLSVNTVLNLASMTISMLILSVILRHAWELLSRYKPAAHFTYLLLGLGVIFSSFRAYKIEATWTRGQSENAIVYMVRSIFDANSNSSFFTTKIPESAAPFDPVQATKFDTPFPEPDKHNVRNVLFIILESAGAAYFDDFGGTFQLSPNLNRYAGQALIFDQMYAHAPATNLSLVSILGSMYPYLSYKSLTQEVPGFEFPTLSSVLKDKGYRTSFFSSADLSFQNCKQFLTYRGFDRIEDFSAIKCGEEFQLDNSDYQQGCGIDDMCLADHLVSWIDENSTQNFFSMIWTVQGHYPYFFAQKEEDFGVSNYYFNRYLNCLKHDDELIGRIMQSLADRGLAETTLVVVCGDHGEAFGQHRQYGHGTAVYEENIRVPFYLINSTLFHGERRSDVAGLKDLATTALSVIGIDIPHEWQGRDLLSTTSSETFFFAPWSDYLFGYRKDNMKYIFNESQNTVEVYDLNSDPHEKRNLYHAGTNDGLEDARNRVAAWVQLQAGFVKKLLGSKKSE